MPELTIMQKVRWLQKNYKAYSDEWYLKDHDRTNAIYLREKAVEHERQMYNLHMEQEDEMIKKDLELRKAYYDKYYSQYDEDLKVDKRLVMERVRNL